jgi:hypothetical protein
MKKEYSKKSNEDLEVLRNFVASAKLKAGKIISDAEAVLKHQIAGCALREIGRPNFKSREFPLRSELDYANHIIGVIVRTEEGLGSQFNFIMFDGRKSDFEFLEGDLV